MEALVHQRHTSSAPGSGSRAGLLPVPQRLFRRERDLESYLNLWRLGLLGLSLLAFSFLRPAGAVQNHEGVVIGLLLSYFLVASGLQGLLAWGRWHPRIPGWVTATDVGFVFLLHLGLVAVDRPLLATNSQAAFWAYFLAVALVGVRSDTALARRVQVAAPLSYAFVVFLAVAWRGAEMAPADAVLGPFRWEAQLLRLGALAVTAHLVALGVTLSYVDRTAAQRDPLTGTFNRRHLQEYLARQVRHAWRQRRPLALLVLDLDGFKGFNDRFGHLMGDQALTEVAAILRSRLRSTDVVARYGGDEFVVVLPDATGEDARRIAAGLVEVGVRGLRFSVGVACLSERRATLGDLLAGADEALLRAKRLGGGVCVASDGDRNG